MRSVWLHVHVPKAGGSTLRQLFNRTFGEGYYNSSSLLETRQYSREDVSEIIRCHPWLRGFSDHKLSLDLPFDSAHADVRALCFVRDPVARFISRFQFHRHFEEVNCIAQKMTFRQFAVTELVEKQVHPQTNSQIRFLNGGSDDRCLDVITAAVATGKTLLFPIGQFDRACIGLERLFPETFIDLSYVRVNSSQTTEIVSPEDREFIGGLLADDDPIVELACQQIEEWLRRAFADDRGQDAALAEFQDRCSRRHHNFRPLRDKDRQVSSESPLAQDQSTNRPAHRNPNQPN